MVRIISRAESRVVTNDALEYSLDGLNFQPLADETFTDSILIRGNGAIELSGAPCKIYGDTEITIKVMVDEWPGLYVNSENAYTAYFVDGEETDYYEFAQGTEVEVRVVAMDGYVFSHWSDSTEDEPHVENPRFFVLNDSIDIEAISVLE